MTSSLDPATLFSCAGQVAVVTGAATGIGNAAAEALGAAGARVLVVGLPGPETTAAADRLTDLGIDAAAHECDVTDAFAPSGIVTAALDRWGRIDTVLCNAGAALDSPDGTTSADALTRMFDLHVRSVLALAEAALPVMADGGGGAFLILSSIAGLRGNRVLSGYGVTKAANAQAARNLAVQWGGRGIRSNAISPGVIDTAFARPITGDSALAQARQAATPLGRFGTAREVAGAVVWLASPAGAFVTGQNIVIDGGTLVAD